MKPKQVHSRIPRTAMIIKLSITTLAIISIFGIIFLSAIFYILIISSNSYNPGFPTVVDSLTRSGNSLHHFDFSNGTLKSSNIQEPETASETLASLSVVVQEELATLQRNNTLCGGPTISCGHRGWCGLGCQVHHRMTCVALSYAMKIPLIHEDRVGWPYVKPWKNTFEGPGSSCKPGPHTIKVRWLGSGPYLFRESSKKVRGRWGLETHTTHEVIPFPLVNGFVVPRRIGFAVQEQHENPFLWWAGQFAKFTMKLSKEQARLVNQAKLSIGLNQGSHPTVGIQVRRTDKILESRNSHHPVSEYFVKAFSMLKKFLNMSEKYENCRIFLASDDHTVLQEARKIYPRKSIVGFATNQTFYTQRKRRNSLDEILRDLVILSESDFIVCGLSSNLCRILLELMSARHSDASRRLKSVDGIYNFYIQGIAIPNKVIFV